MGTSKFVYGLTVGAWFTQMINLAVNVQGEPYVGYSLLTTMLTGVFLLTFNFVRDL